MTQCIKFYAAPMSLFSGKVRAYLRKQHIAFEEVMPGHAEYREKVFPKTKRGIVPVVALANGDLLQDTVDIIDHFENSEFSRFSVYPKTPKQRTAALMLDMFGSEGLFKVAMHYRWNFLEDNESFIKLEFGDHIAPGATLEDITAVAHKVMQPMQAYLPMLGVNQDTIPAIEEQYLQLLDLLNAHFQHHPYLLGGLPSVADYGLYAPLYAHLSRDPYPGAIMKNRAQRVYRWIERMSAPDSDIPEYPGYVQEYFGDDAVPETLQAILKLVAEDFLPELQVTVKEIDIWLANNPDVTGQCVTEKPRIKALKPMDYPFRGTTVTGIVIPYQLYMLQRITDFYAEQNSSEQSKLQEFYSGLALADWLTLSASRRVERSDLIEVWGEAV